MKDKSGPDKMSPEDERKYLADIRAIFDRAKQIGTRIDKTEFLTPYVFQKFTEAHATEMALFIAATSRMGTGGASLPGILVLLGILWSEIENVKLGVFEGLFSKIQEEDSLRSWEAPKGTKPS